MLSFLWPWWSWAPKVAEGHLELEVCSKVTESRCQWTLAPHTELVQLAQHQAPAAELLGCSPPCCVLQGLLHSSLWVCFFFGWCKILFHICNLKAVG